ncbi:hypothetical protein [Anaerotignum lactatifermentans]|uniref:hypothetical protein n=1 Tax=Anaerotignum lactatifermentans TaxID=160404 RepID=UPI003AB4F6DD
MEENRNMELMNLAGRLERLRRLMGQDMPQSVQQTAPAMEEEREKQEKMLMAAIPFLDQEYQRDLYVVVRLMEMRRMLTGGVLQARSRDTLPPSVRRRQMLSAIRPCLSQREQTRLDTLMRVMDAREILIQKEGLDGLDKGANGGSGRGTAAADSGGSGKKQG